jgi:hypothetical protein
LTLKLQALVLLPCFGREPQQQRRTINNAGSNGNYWSSSVNGSNARNLNFNSGNAGTNNNNRANGFSARCLADEWGTFLPWSDGKGFHLPENKHSSRRRARWVV